MLADLVPTDPRTGYVVKMYPRFSETFIVRELLARQAQGEQLAVASLRAPTDGRFHAALAGVRAPVTWIDQAPARSASALWQLVGRARSLPGAAVLDRLLDDDVEVAAGALGVALWAHDLQVDHLHAHFATLPGRTARWAAALCGIGYSLTAHAKDLFVDGADAPWRDAVLRDAATVVTVSDFNAAWIEARCPGAAVARVYNGLDLDELSWSPPLDRPRVVAAVGRLVEKKGFDDLLRAVALLHRAGDPVRLVLAGTGRCGAALRAQADAAGIADAVTFAGAVPQHEVMDLLRGSAVFAAPCVEAADGDRDGLPTVLLEAMAVGTPVVSTPVTGVPEAVLDGLTGLLVPQRDPAALADALRQVLDSPDLAARLAAAARSHVEERFDVREQARALREITHGIARSSLRGNRRPALAVAR